MVRLDCSLFVVEVVHDFRKGEVLLLLLSLELLVHAIPELVLQSFDVYCLVEFELIQYDPVFPQETYLRYLTVISECHFF